MSDRVTGTVKWFNIVEGPKGLQASEVVFV
jgi:cold shock CspA family protein